VRRIRLHDYVAPIAKCEPDDTAGLGHDRDVESGAAQPAQPPLQAAGMKDRTGIPALSRAADEREDGREVAVAVERPNARFRRG
jgi:hypothetical protein